MFVSVEEHERARIIQLIHGNKVGNLGDINEIYDGKVLDAFRNGE